MTRLRCALLLALLPVWATAQLHHSLEATLSVPFRSEAERAERNLLIQAEFPQAPGGTRLFYEVRVRAPDGQVISVQSGERSLSGNGVRDAISIAWPPAELSGSSFAPGFYQAEMVATALEPWLLQRLGGDPAGQRVSRALELAPNGRVQQIWDFQIGQPARPQMPEFAGLPGADTPRVLRGAAQPYTVYLANLHSQSNHSDGGGNVATCTSSQGAQEGQFGPTDAYIFANQHGLDALMVSEHNHYFDGNGSGTSASALPATVIALYQSGLDAARNYALANPDFLPMYGMEWGVISGGGHLNIFGAGELWGWEFNGANQLLAAVLTPRNDYAALYQQMLKVEAVGQFNHADSSGQFLIDGESLAWNPVADEVMALAEILNTSAFSNKIDESETGQSSFQSAFNRMLEKGFHVAPTSNQDNHCANWGASAPNRTGILIPNGTVLSESAMLDAFRARRVFATTDKTSQIVFEAGNHIMGERFTHSGPLQLRVLYASTSGQTAAQVQIFEGVPQRNGTVTQLAATAVHNFTPSVGEHFYYAKITQTNGRLLWSAPVWVSQTPEVLVDPVFANGFETVP